MIRLDYVEKVIGKWSRKAQKGYLCGMGVDWGCND
tara:strand:+ start:2759 stop:2863 length:105 start_codon:yes stop_codon:yes gene_type:complete